MNLPILPRKSQTLLTLAICLVFLTVLTRADSPTGVKLYSHTLTYQANDDTPHHIFASGDFNGWSQDANPLTRVAPRQYSVTLSVPEGVHYYKFLVDGNWVNDPHSDTELEIPDGYGGRNSAFLVGPDARRAPPPQPGKIDADLLHHDPADVRDLNVVSTSQLRLGFIAQQHNITDAAVLFTTDGNTWQQRPLFPIRTHLGLEDFAGLINPSQAPVQYLFKLVDGPTTAYFADGNLYASQQEAQSHAWSCSMQPTFVTPDWAKHAIWYQIFPERFRNGDPRNDPPNTKKWNSNWWGKLDGETGKFYQDVWNRRYGGDFQGIIWALPYLRSLGINCIYLNPIFKAQDLHKYDTSDYRHVDDHFGFAGDIDQLKGETDNPSTWQWTKTDKLFLQFLADAHAQGFHVIIDGVFNHVGVANYAFQDVMKNGRASRYADWFEITSWHPFHWTGWGGAPDGMLPEFKKDPNIGLVHGPRELIMNITRRWLAPDGDPSRGVDGFRLDACENVPKPFWVDWRKLVKSIRPDAYLSGEIWSVAPGWLDGQTFDATMQYPFAEAMESFFVDQNIRSTPSTFAAQLQQFTFVYPFQVSLDQMNLLDSHDTDRWASRFVNPDLPFNGKSRVQDNNPNYNISTPTSQDWTRMKQSLVVQMTYVGAPMIYYGDETGMCGPSDPSDREPMTWKDLQPYANRQVYFHQDIFDQYQRLIAIHAHITALQLGFAHTVLADDEHSIYAFSRDLRNDHVCVVVNRTPRTQETTLKFGDPSKPAALINWLDPREVSVDAGAIDTKTNRPEVERLPSAHPAAVLRNGQATVTLPPWGAMILSMPDVLTN